MNDRNQVFKVPEETTLTKVREGSDSLKTVVPPGVRSFLDLQANEFLVWELVMENNQKYARLTKKAVKEE